MSEYQSQTILGRLVDEVRQVFQDDHTVLSFHDYFHLVMQLPERHTRNSAQYMVDMIDHFGTETIALPHGEGKHFKLFDGIEQMDKRHFVAGHDEVLYELYQSFANFAQEGIVNKLILLHGPNGSAKSSICRTLMDGLETYARTAAGSLYSFSWIFPSDRLQSSEKIGFGPSIKDQIDLNTFAHLPTEHIDARVPCDMHDHPMFLFPLQQRRQVLNQVQKRLHNRSVADYLKSGDLCHKCRRIYDALLANYKGDLNKLLKHVQVERMFLSYRYRRGLATVEPQLSVDAKLQQLTMDHSLAALPKALYHTSLFEPMGPLVDANRGMIEYSDLLKRPVEAFKYLLGTIETSSVPMDSYLLHLDLLYLASANEIYLEAFKQHPDFPSFKSRIQFLKVPYLLKMSEEKKIYLPLVEKDRAGKHVAPHAIDVAALWAVLTRLKPVDISLYPKEVQPIIASLTPLEKVHLYDSGTAPDRLSAQEAKDLQLHLQQLIDEGRSTMPYEGLIGASAREIYSALLNAIYHSQFKCLHPVAVLEELLQICQSPSVHEFLRQDIVSGYFNHKGFLEQTEKLYFSWIQQEVFEASGIAAQESFTDLFSRYIFNISHWIKGEKVHDTKTGSVKDPDEHLMMEIEKVLLKEGEVVHDFRRTLIGQIGAYTLDHPQSSTDYSNLFKHYIVRLKESFFEKRSKMIYKIVENLLKLHSDDKSMVSEKDAETAWEMEKILMRKFGYCKLCVNDTLAYLLKRMPTE